MVNKSIILLILLILLTNCDLLTNPDSDLPAKPTIIRTGENYSIENLNNSFPKTEYNETMNEAYSGKYTEEMRKKLLEYVKKRVIKLGENPSVFDNILEKAGCKDEYFSALPAYAERAKYKNEEVWLIQIANGFGNDSFGHFRFYVFRLMDLEILYHTSCK